MCWALSLQPEHVHFFKLNINIKLICTCYPSFLIYPGVFDELNSFTIIPLFIILCDMWIQLEYVGM